MPPTAGYSGTPLFKKLGISAGATVCAVGAPADYRTLLAPIPEGVTFTTRLSERTDVVHLFVRDGRFREDLFYRINAFSIRLPSLRERPVDIPVLAQRFLARYCAANGLPLDARTLSREAIETLTSYPWPGNIRELESTMARAALSAAGTVIRASDIEFLHPSDAPFVPASDRLPTLAEVERAHILRVLEATHWNKKEAAALLEISRGTLYRKIQEYTLQPAAPRQAS